MLLFLQLYAAHLIADFLLQPAWIVREKRRPGALAAHAAIHVACGCALVNLGLTGPVFLWLVGLAAFHAAVDYGKARLAGTGWAAFVADQAIHLGSVAVVATALNPGEWPAAQATVGAFLRSPRLYLLLSAYVGVLFGGGYVIQKVTQPFLERIEENLRPLKPGLPQAGTYIGWVERFLVLTFVIGGYKEAIGFLLAVKALARFPEIKEDTKGHFAEYFLLGTLTSFGLSLVAALAVKKLLLRM